VLRREDVGRRDAGADERARELVVAKGSVASARIPENSPPIPASSLWVREQAASAEYAKTTICQPDSRLSTVFSTSCGHRFPLWWRADAVDMTTVLTGALGCLALRRELASRRCGHPASRCPPTRGWPWGKGSHQRSLSRGGILSACLRRRDRLPPTRQRRALAGSILARELFVMSKTIDRQRVERRKAASTSLTPTTSAAARSPSVNAATRRARPRSQRSVNLEWWLSTSTLSGAAGSKSST
jgi:hypothetical protein